MTEIAVLPQKVVDTKTAVLKSRIDSRMARSQGEQMKKTLFRNYGFLRPNAEDVQLVGFEKYYEPYLVIGGTYSIDYCRQHVCNVKVEENTRFIFLLLGKQDLKNKLMKILNYQDAKVNRIDLSNAELIVDDAALSYGNGIYWFPSHEFNIVIPKLTVSSPQATRNFTMTREFPGGMGYFATEIRDIPDPMENIRMP